MTKGLRSQLAEGRVSLGSWINTASPIVAELMSAAGFDFLTIDAEHSPVDVPQVQQLLQAVRSGNPECTPLVRVPGCDYAQIKRFMDAGAAGIICPLVNTADQAREVVAAVKYPEDKGGETGAGGRRGVGFCRDNGYGARLVDVVAAANRTTLVAVQIEHVAALEEIDAILAVDGVDVAFIGPYDLTASMGITAQFTHPAYLQAKRTILKACGRHGVAPGIHVVQPEPVQVSQAVREGYRFIAYSLDITMLNRACADGLQQIRTGMVSGKRRPRRVPAGGRR